MKINTLSMFAVLALVGFTNQLLAEERADVLERIAPIGKVAVEGQDKPAPVPAPVAEAAPAEAPAAEAPATEAAAAPATEAPAAAPVAEAPAAEPAAGGDQLALATASGCMACHNVEMKIVGPAYKDVAAKYKGDAGALDRLAAKVKAGGSGVWGPVPMPPNVQVSDENIRAIVTWVLSL